MTRGLAVLGMSVLLAASVATSALAADVQVTDPWVRFILSTTPAAGYFTLHNQGKAPIALDKASSPDCGMIMLHRSVNKNGSEVMEMVPSVPVPAGGEVHFAPGGYHLMCMSPKAEMKPGAMVPITLGFDDGSSVTTQFPVRGATGK